MILVGTEKDLDVTYGLYSHKISPDPLLIELKEFVKDKYDGEIINYILETLKRGQGYFYRLCLFTWSDDDEQFLREQNSFDYDRKKIEEISSYFKKLIVKYQKHKEYLNIDLFVCTCEIKSALRDRIVDSCEFLRDLLVKEFNDIYRVIWDFGEFEILYYTDENIKNNNKNGKSKKIKEIINNEIKKRDLYNCFDKGVDVNFYSKQLIDEKYEGSLFYFSRR